MRTTGLSQRYHGIYLGTVVDADDPDGLGRVRVRTPQRSDTADRPAWAAVARPQAGDGTGVYFSPRPGDQVVVGYVAGDPREPLVLGYAHSARKRPDGGRVSPRRHGVISSVGRIVIDEDEGTITVELEGATAPSIKLSPDGVEVRALKVDVVTPPVGGVISLTGSVVVSGPLAAASIAAGALTLGGAGAPPDAALTCEGKLTLKTGNGVEIEGDRLCVDGKGVVLEPFLDRFANHTHKIEPPSSSETQAPNEASGVPPNQATEC